MFEGQPSYRDRHVRQIESRMTKLSAKHRRELIGLLGSPPNINNVPPAFWKKVNKETYDTLAALLILIWMSEALEQGVAYKDYDGASEDWSSRRAEWVSDRYTDWSEELVNRKLDSLSVEDLRGMSPDELDDLMRPVFGPKRAGFIANMETTKGITGARIQIGSAGDADSDFIWNLSDDVANCRFCILVNGFGRDVWGPFTDGPPCHWHCQCWLTRINGRASSVGAPSHAELVLAAQEVGVFEPDGIGIT